MKTTFKIGERILVSPQVTDFGDWIKATYQRDFFVQKIEIDFLQNSYIPRYKNWYI